MKKQILKIGISPILVLFLISFMLPDASAQAIIKNKDNSGPRDIDIITVNTWVYLEGALTNVQIPENYVLPMRSHLNRVRMLPGQSFVNFSGDTIYMPPGQPYNMAPWFYYGNEGEAYDSNGDPDPGTAGYPMSAVDWVLVSLRLTPDGEPVCRKAGLLHDDGHVEFPGGGFDCEGLDELGTCYIVIQHRNHLMVMSAAAVPVIRGKVTFDFRNSQSYINDPFLSGSVGQKELTPNLPGAFSMYAGNGCQAGCAYSDHDINLDDRDCWELVNRTMGYRPGDYNMNGDCNFNDRLIWEANNGMFTSVP